MSQGFRLLIGYRGPYREKTTRMRVVSTPMPTSDFFTRMTEPAYEPLSLPTQSSEDAGPETPRMPTDYQADYQVGVDMGAGPDETAIAFVGLPKALDEFMVRLSESVQMPSELLMGQSAAGMRAIAIDDPEDEPVFEPGEQPPSETRVRVLTPAEARRHAFVCKTEGLPETAPLDPARARELAVHQSAGIAEGLRETRLNVARLKKLR